MERRPRERAARLARRWWDRDFKDETNDPNDRYDKGAPDYQADYPEEEREVIKDGEPSGEKHTYQKPQNLKWRVICAGVERLIAEQGLDEADVSLWLDWQSSAPRRRAPTLRAPRRAVRPPPRGAPPCAPAAAWQSTRTTRRRSSRACGA